MNKQGHRHSARKQASFRQAWQQTFGASLAMPRANKGAVAMLALVSLLGTGVAMAAWEVNDRNTQREIQDVEDVLVDVRDNIGSNGTVTGHLRDINRKLQVSQRSSNATPEMIAEPTGDEALNHTQPTATSVTMDALCTAGASTSLGQQQQQLCQELARTELAQYRFSMRMFERAEKNYERLKQIEERRSKLTAEDYANVQYNTNELLALTALMDNDRDRYRTYMSAYEARISHINNSRTALTRNALKGSGSVGLPGVSGLSGGAGSSLPTL